MTNGDSEKEFKEVGNARSQNSLVWAGFSLTNFVTIVAIFFAFGVEISIPFQVATSFFLIAGTFFAVGWAFNETAGSAYRIKAHPYRIWKQRNTTENNELAPNPRETCLRQAQYCNLAGTLMWSIGVFLLLWDLQMPVTAIIWTLTAIAGYSFAIPRYFNWGEQ